ncbi:unnamed protein product [Adineta steineri]|uniref:Uncharacterized protein n=1 Tax=Adineta steineri TaxID=433720 RepID=A0A815EJF5_9BILA|nr:unnamed protein product [Adineta steineri]CAF1312319.1 unnamed protein product [Adineta steineri]CAF3707760.1 unnamed protein product [Adineta steineri]CAF4075116.1 unnamed protein product [Adineta steineri]
MPDNKIETCTYSKTVVEHCSSPVVMNNSHNNESFYLTRSLSYCDMDLSQQQQESTEGFYLSSAINVNDNKCNHLETSQRSLSTNTLGQLNRQLFPLSSPASCSIKYLPGQAASSLSHHPNAGSVTAIQSPARSMNPSSKQHPQLLTVSLTRTNRR